MHRTCSNIYHSKSVKDGFLLSFTFHQVLTVLPYANRAPYVAANLSMVFLRNFSALQLRHRRAGASLIIRDDTIWSSQVKEPISRERFNL